MFGRGPRSPTWAPQPETLGDEVVKSEARKMIKEFTPSAVSPLKSAKKDELALTNHNEIPSPFN